jgi:TPR repeat protein
MYEDGRGVGRDISRAIALYRRACEVGNSLACQLAVLREEGLM